MKISFFYTHITHIKLSIYISSMVPRLHFLGIKQEPTGYFEKEEVYQNML